MNKNQIKSKKRVSDHAEVFTNQREVERMLDLVEHETKRIDSRFLEPACGTGNFLIAILVKKLITVKIRYRNSQREWERYSLIAISSCYGVDILQDNIIECRQNLIDIYENEYKSIYKNRVRPEVLNTARYILSRNIVCGDALTMLNTNGNPLTFAEWNAINHSKIKRRDFTLSHLLQTEDMYESRDKQLNLFAVSREQGIELAVPKPVREFSLVDFDAICDMEEEHECKE